MATEHRSTRFSCHLEFVKILRFPRNAGFIPCHRKYSQSEYRKDIAYRRYYSQRSHRAPRVCRKIMLATLFSKAWCKIAIWRFLVVYHGISHLSLVFFGIHTYPRKYKWLVSVILHGMPQESVTQLQFVSNWSKVGGKEKQERGLVWLKKREPRLHCLTCKSAADISEILISSLLRELYWGYITTSFWAVQNYISMKSIPGK